MVITWLSRGVEDAHLRFGALGQEERVIGAMCVGVGRCPLLRASVGFGDCQGLSHEIPEVSGGVVGIMGGICLTFGDGGPVRYVVPSVVPVGLVLTTAG